MDLGLKSDFSYYSCDNGYKPEPEGHLIIGLPSMKWGEEGRFTSQDIFFLVINEIKHETTSTHNKYY